LAIWISKFSHESLFEAIQNILKSKGQKFTFVITLSAETIEKKKEKKINPQSEYENKQGNGKHRMKEKVQEQCVYNLT